MVNKSKDIGTKAESAVLKRVKLYWPKADRAALHGTADIGDLLNTGRVTFEVKGGEAARSASDSQIDEWLLETERERIHAGGRIGVLVVQRRGFGLPNAGQWWAIMRLDDFSHITSGSGVPLPAAADLAPVRMRLDDLLQHLGDWGWTE